MNFNKIMSVSLGLCASALSAKLSFDFMASIAPMLGLMAVVLEGAKAILPKMTVLAWGESRPLTAIFRGVVLFLLVALSFSASVYCVTDSATKSTQESAQYKTLTRMIDSKLSDVERLRSIKHSSDAAKLEATIEPLIAKRDGLKPDNVLSQYGGIIAIVIAGSIELVILALALYSPESNKSAPTPPKKNAPASPDAGLTPKAEISTVVPFAPRSAEDDQIVRAIIKGDVRPAVNAVANAYRIGKTRASEILDGLENAGSLVRVGNRRVLAA